MRHCAKYLMCMDLCIYFDLLLVRLSTAKTANAERRLAVCRLPFRSRCSSDDTAELGTRLKAYKNCLHLKLTS